LLSLPKSLNLYHNNNNNSNNMSEGYASRLSKYPKKGVCGLPENFDSKRALAVKLKRLGGMVAASKHFVVMTGAGISTSAGIPDFRGPQGVWTLEKERTTTTAGRHPPKKKLSTSKRKRHDQSSNSTAAAAAAAAGMDFSKAHPTLTHRAISKLASVGTLKFCITQNVDGLHRRSGLSRNHHAALHGCAFTETCASCQTEHFRDQDVGGMSFQPTGRICGLEGGCQGKLHDTLLDWEDPLPEDDFERAEQECDASDLVLCLGTSLRIEPAGSLPMRAKQFVIVNLQMTAKDDESALIIRAPVDEVMEYLMKHLGYEDWEKEDPPPIERHWKLKKE
jgi:mono-ADP-ribosyltransferase sirtuin 6